MPFSPSTGSIITPDPDCLFCKIATGKLPATVVYDGGDTLFFNDIAPKAKVHVLGIPKEHIPSLHKIQGDHHLLVGKLLHDAVHVASDLGLDTGGYRVLTNIGANAGQVVGHLHFHILGGEPLGAMVSK